MCILHCTSLESIIRKGFHRVNNRLCTGFVKMYYNYILTKRFLYFMLHCGYMAIIHGRHVYYVRVQ
jgi:hypothetical protein